MSFKDHYSTIKNTPKNFRGEICRLLQISEKTFYNRMENNSWTSPEKVSISLFLEESVETLFPEP